MAVGAGAFQPEVRQHLNATADAFDPAHTTVEPVSIFCRIREATGTYRWFELHAYPIRDTNGHATRWYGFASDTDDAQTSEHLKASEAALEKASRMATVAELSASIAHEINQPLSAIMTNSAACNRWLSAAVPNMARAKQAMERVVRDARSVSDVVERVRALYRYGPLSRAQLDLNALAHETRELMRSECARAHVSVSLDLSNALPPVLCDRVQIQQVLTNLIRNAIEAMKTSSTLARSITVSTGIVGTGKVCLAVSDSGPGFADDVRAFEAFYTTKEHGMGMGLAICRSIVEAHCGTIVAHNIPPHGASVEVILPMPASDACDTDC